MLGMDQNLVIAQLGEIDLGKNTTTNFFSSLNFLQYNLRFFLVG